MALHQALARVALIPVVSNEMFSPITWYSPPGMIPCRQPVAKPVIQELGTLPLLAPRLQMFNY